MTKKRYLNIIPSGIEDTETGKIIRGSKIGDLLNEKEERIRKLEKKNERLEMRINRERSATEKQYKKWKEEAELKIMRLELEVEMLKRFKRVTGGMPKSIDVIIRKGDAE